MSSFLVRLVATESRVASQSFRTAGTKRKRGSWTCGECQAVRAAQHRRAFGNGARFPTRQTVSAYGPLGLINGEEKWTDPQGKVHERDIQEGERSRDQQPSSRAELESVWEDSERAEEEEEELDEDTKPARSTLASRVATRLPLLNIDYVSALPYALANNEPDTIARCLVAAGEANDLTFIQNIPRTTFAECIRLLQPCNFTEPLAEAHLEISNAVGKQLDLSPIQRIAWQHMRLLRKVLLTRRNAGVTVGLPEYKMLLRAAQDLGMRNMSQRIWDSLIQDGHTPDTDCYNYRMAATVWNRVHDARTRHAVRVIKIYQDIRVRKRGHKSILHSNYTVGRGGLKEAVTHIFNDMLAHGAAADEKSFRNVILAAAREGDMSIVKSILRKVWKVDVDALMAGKSETPDSDVANDREWKLRPTSKLLFALAHAFGINNDIPTALRVVDHVARRYQIDIDTETWHQLFEYTFVLAAKRSGRQSESSGAEVGRLPIQSLLSLWDTMTGPPYNVKPTMGMYNHLIKNLQQRDSPTLMYEKMREALELSQIHLAHANEANLAVNAAYNANKNGPPTSKAATLEALRRNWERKRLIKYRNKFWLKRWARLLLSTTQSFVYLDVQMDCSLRMIPRFLWNWRHFAPTLVRYDTIGGMVEFRIRSDEDVERDKEAAEKEERADAWLRTRVPLFVEDPWPSQRTPRNVDGGSEGKRESAVKSTTPPLRAAA